MQIIKTFLAITITLIITNLKQQVFSQNYWDVPVTEELIAHNKHNYNDHQDVRNNQIVSTATVTKWKQTKDELKNIIDKIDKRFTEIFIVAADATTLYNSYTALYETLDYQRQSFQLLAKYPYALIIFYDAEVAVVKSAQELFGFITLILYSYGDINKMEVNSRNTVFRGLTEQLYVLETRAMSLLNRLKQIDVGATYKNSKGWMFVNRDKEIVQDIFKNLKF